MQIRKYKYKYKCKYKNAIGAIQKPFLTQTQNDNQECTTTTTVAANSLTTEFWPLGRKSTIFHLSLTFFSFTGTGA